MKSNADIGLFTKPSKFGNYFSKVQLSHVSVITTPWLVIPQHLPWKCWIQASKIPLKLYFHRPLRNYPFTKSSGLLIATRGIIKAKLSQNFTLNQQILVFNPNQCYKHKPEGDTIVAVIEWHGIIPKKKAGTGGSLSLFWAVTPYNYLLRGVRFCWKLDFTL